MKPKNLLTISVCLLLLSTLLLSIILKYKRDDNKNVNSDILKNINLENIKKIEITKLTEGGVSKENLTSKKDIEEIYNYLSKLKIGDETDIACSDNEITYKIILNDEEKTIKFECGNYIKNNKRYKLNKVQ